MIKFQSTAGLVSPLSLIPNALSGVEGPPVPLKEACAPPSDIPTGVRQMDGLKGRCRCMDYPDTSPTTRPPFKSRKTETMLS